MKTFQSVILQGIQIDSLVQHNLGAELLSDRQDDCRRLIPNDLNNHIEPFHTYSTEKKYFSYRLRHAGIQIEHLNGFKEDGDLCSSHWIVTSTKLYIILCPPASCSTVQKVKEHYLKELNRLGKDETW